MMGALKGKVSASRSGRNTPILLPQVASDKEFDVFKHVFITCKTSIDIFIALLTDYLSGCDVFCG
jgi:hypothetical protein